MRQLNEKSLNAITDTDESSVIKSDFHMACSVQAVSTGLTGTLKLMFSNDDQSGTPTNFSDIPSATVTVSGAGVFSIPKTEVCYNFIKVVFTKSGGAGSVTANYHSYGF
jgi:hypothetical protein